MVGQRRACRRFFSQLGTDRYRKTSLPAVFLCEIYGLITGETTQFTGKDERKPNKTIRISGFRNFLRAWGAGAGHPCCLHCRPTLRVVQYIIRIRLMNNSNNALWRLFRGFGLLLIVFCGFLRGFIRRSTFRFRCLLLLLPLCIWH
jgi:hypothetical protein